MTRPGGISSLTSYDATRVACRAAVLAAVRHAETAAPVVQALRGELAAPALDDAKLPGWLR